MTPCVSISTPALVSKLTEEEQARFFDAATSGRVVDADILERLKQLDQEAQAVVE
jgi:hypothetical protein